MKRKLGRIKKKKRTPTRHIAFSALEIGDFDMLKIKRDADPDLAHVKDLNGITLLMTALSFRKQEVVDLLLETAGPLTAVEASALGREERLAELLDSGEATLADLSPEGFGLLHLACFFGQPGTAALLLDRGAKIEAVAAHPMGIRPVHGAAAGGHTAIVSMLLDRGADVNSRQGGGWTLLHHAASQGDEAFTDMLLSRGAEATATNERGETPADVATARGHTDLAAKLGA